MEKKSKKSRLGKGLSELLGEAREQSKIVEHTLEEFETEIKKESETDKKSSSKNKSNSTSPEETGEVVYLVPIEKVEPNPSQPRKEFDSEALQSLADSIKEYGVLQPLLVAPQAEKETFTLVAGERRWRACQLADISLVPVIIKDLSDARLLQVALIENLQREDLSPLEEAECYKYLMNKYNMTQNEIASTIGKSRSYVANIIRMLRLDGYVKALLSSGDISVGHAKILASLPPEESKHYAEETVKKGLNVRALEKRINGNTGIQKSSYENMPKQKDEDTLALEADLVAALGLSVSIQNNKSGRGSLTISYDTLDQLDNICKKLCHIDGVNH